jgi:hypothetical protein
MSKSRFSLLLIMMLLLSNPLWANEATEEGGGAIAAYKKFATAFIQGKLTEATALAEGKALRVVRKKQYQISKGRVDDFPVEVEIMVVGEIYSQPKDRVEVMGVLLARHILPKTQELSTIVHRQDISLIRRESGWMVLDFNDNLEQCCL